MFVKIVIDGIGMTAIHECKSARIRPQTSSKEHVIVTLEDPHYEVSIYKKASVVYFMNNVGKTFDTYSWS